MTQHTDKFGRSWNFTPAHDTNKMLQIKPHVFQAARTFQNVLLGTVPDLNFCVEMDCYLLKGTLGGRVYWNSGIRLSDHASDYFSNVVDEDVAQLIVRHHNRGWLSREESEAYWELVQQPQFQIEIALKRVAEEETL